MTDKLFGWVVHVKPGPENKALGYADVRWEIYETLDGGIDSIEAQLPPDWECELHCFGFADDMAEYAGLHGVCAFKRTNAPENVQYAPLHLGKHNVAAEFVLCGYIGDRAIPLHTEQLAHEVIQWFVTKQAQWHDRYSPKPDSEAPQENDQASGADPSGWPAQCGSRKTLH